MRLRCRRLTLMLISSTLLSLSSFAQAPSEDAQSLMALDIEELLQMKVVSATKREQTLEQAPAIVDIITRDDIRRYGYRTVGEALRSVAGVAIVNDHVNWNVGVRGFYAEPGSGSETLKVMINGQSIAFRPLASNVFGPELLPMEAVERIEVIRGPASALYGGNAFLGVINILTRDPKTLGGDKHAQTLAIEGFARQHERAQFLNGSASLLAMGQQGNLGYLVAGTFLSSDRSGLQLPGFNDIVLDYFSTDREKVKGFPSPALEPQIRRGYLENAISQNDLERVGSVYGTLTYQLGAANTLTLDVNHQHFDRYGEFQDFSVLTHRNRIAYRNSYVRLRYQLAPSEARCSGGASLTWATGAPNELERIIDSRSPDTYKQRNFGYTAFDTVIDGSCKLGENHIVSAGIDYSYDREDLLHLVEINPATGGTNVGRDFGDKTFNTVGGLVQWQWQVTPQLGVTAGARVDYNDQIACNAQTWKCIGRRPDRQFTDEETRGRPLLQSDRGIAQLSGRLGVVYNFPWANLYSKALYGSSFKPPSPFELYHDPLSTAATTAGDPTLRPQTADTLELLVGSRLTEGLHVSGNIFYTSASDIVIPLLEKAVVLNHNADVSTAGVELNLSYRISKTFSGFFNVSHLLSSSVRPKKLPGESDAAWELSPLSTDVPVGIYPDWLLNLGASMAMETLPLVIGMDIHFVGTRRPSLVNSQLFNPFDLHDTYPFDPYFVVNATISTAGIKIIGNRETVFSLRLAGIPGGAMDPGYGGIDIPSLGPQVHLRIEQAL